MPLSEEDIKRLKEIEEEQRQKQIAESDEVKVVSTVGSRMKERVIESGEQRARRRAERIESRASRKEAYKEEYQRRKVEFSKGMQASRIKATEQRAKTLAEKRYGRTPTEKLSDVGKRFEGAGKKLERFLGPPPRGGYSPIYKSHTSRKRNYNPFGSMFDTGMGGLRKTKKKSKPKYTIISGKAYPIAGTGKKKKKSKKKRAGFGGFDPMNMDNYGFFK